MIVIAAYQGFAGETNVSSEDTLAFAPNSKLYDNALLSGMLRNTQLPLVQNSDFEFYQAYLGIPYSINYSLDGVELNSILDAGINLMNFTGSYYKQPNMSTESGLSAIPTIEFISENPSKSSFSGFTHFGNNKLLANIEANYRKNNFFVLTHANYNNHNAYKVPKRVSVLSIDSNNNLLNSEFSGKSVFVKTGIIEDYSELTAEYLHINNSRNIPLNYLESNSEYLKENQYKMNLMNIKYKSKMSSLMSLCGNFYYRDNKRILDSYDDATYSSQQSEKSYRYLTKDQILGFDFGTIIIFPKIGKSAVGAFYKRVQLYEKANYDLKAFDYISEILGVKWSQTIPINDNIVANSNIVYKYINPVYPSNNGLANQSVVEYSLAFNHKLSDNFDYTVSYSKNGAFPYIKYIYSKNTPVLENNFCNIAQVKTEFELFGISFQMNGFYSDFANYFKNSGELKRLSGATSGGGIGIEKQLKYVNIDLSYTYINQLESDELFPKISKNNFYLSLGKEYGIGLKWQIESRIFTCQSIDQNLTKLLNLWVQQRIIDHINVFIYADNILNEYYELYPGYSAQGTNFCFGLNVEI